MKELNVKPVIFDELVKQWGRELANQVFRNNRKTVLYIRCNKKGVVNYDVAPVYHESEIKSERKKRVVNIL